MKNLWQLIATLSLIGAIWCLSESGESSWVYVLGGLLASCTIRFTIKAVHADSAKELAKVKTGR